MSKRSLNLIVSVVTLFASASAQAADPKEESCILAAEMAKGTDAILKQFEAMAVEWPEADRAKLDPVFRPELSRFELEAGKVFSVAEFDPYMREHLIVTADKSRATAVFFRVRHVAGPNGYLFRNVKFNSDYEEIFATPLPLEPRPVECD